ncbi:MAG TPA: class I SAM-dependent methyltransferase [Actinomycetota bacterium]|nr:class I SAM-dependent methyltransferase [Actinomycetota bacterium]
MDFQRLGFDIPAAPAEAWRSYDHADPQPGYYQFDWLSSRHPDLYHSFALSTVGLIEELHRLVDLSGLVVVDVGAGTGRSSVGVAAKAGRVLAVDRFPSVVEFGRGVARTAGAEIVQYAVADRAALPVRDSSCDVVMTAWAESDLLEAHRALRPEGLLILMGANPRALSGELSAVLETGDAPTEWFLPRCPPSDEEIEDPGWPVPLSCPLRVRDFTYVADYGTVDECAAIIGRIFGPQAESYIQTRAQSTLAWRLRIYLARLRK